jgi:hypothetical protein
VEKRNTLLQILRNQQGHPLKPPPSKGSRAP